MSRPSYRYVLSRLPRREWVGPEEIAHVMRDAGATPSPEDLDRMVQTWKRRGLVVTRGRSVRRLEDRASA